MDGIPVTELAKAWDNEAAQTLESSHHRVGGTEPGLRSFIGPRSGEAGCLGRPRWAGGHCLGIRPGSPCTASLKIGQAASEAQSWDRAGKDPAEQP